MRALRVAVVGALVAGGLAVMAPGTNASEPAVLPEICRSLTTLNSKLPGLVSGLARGTPDIDALRELSNSLLTGAETAPDEIKPAMNTIGTAVADAVASGNNDPDQIKAALTPNLVTLAVSVSTLSNYFAANCEPALPPPSAPFGFAHKACSLISAYDDGLDRAFEKARNENKKVLDSPQKASLADQKRWLVNTARVSTDMSSALLRKLRALGTPNAKEERASYRALVADVSKLRDIYARALRGAQQLSTTSKATAQRQYNRLLTTENGVPQFLPYYARIMGHSVTLAEANPPSTVSWGAEASPPPSTVPFREGPLTVDQACQDVIFKEAS